MARYNLIARCSLYMYNPQIVRIIVVPAANSFRKPTTAVLLVLRKRQGRARVRAPENLARWFFTLMASRYLDIITAISNEPKTAGLRPRSERNRVR